MFRGFLMSSGVLISGVVVWLSSQASSFLDRKPVEVATRVVEAPRMPNSRVVAEGRVVGYPGSEVLVGTEVEGLIVSLPVQEKSVVRKGQVLAELRSDDLRAELAEARAKVAESEADIRHFEREIRRETVLLSKGVGATHLVDGWRHSLEAAQARRAASIAACERLQARIDKTKIVAPIDGVVIERHADPGEVVQAGAKIVSIADLKRLRIETEVDEYDTSHVVLGGVAVITAEGYDSTRWKGVVEEIPDSVSPRRFRPEDPGRPIDARVLAVKVALSEKTPLRLGQRVEVAIYEPGVFPEK